MIIKNIRSGKSLNDNYLIEILSDDISISREFSQIYADLMRNIFHKNLTGDDDFRDILNIFRKNSDKLLDKYINTILNKEKDYKNQLDEYATKMKPLLLYINKDKELEVDDYIKYVIKHEPVPVQDYKVKENNLILSGRVNLFNTAIRSLINKNDFTGVTSFERIHPKNDVEYDLVRGEIIEFKSGRRVNDLDYLSELRNYHIPKPVKSKVTGKDLYDRINNYNRILETWEIDLNICLRYYTTMYNNYSAQLDATNEIRLYTNGFPDLDEIRVNEILKIKNYEHIKPINTALLHLLNILRYELSLILQKYFVKLNAIRDSMKQDMLLVKRLNTM